MSNRIDRVPRNQRDRRRTARAGTRQKVKKRKLVFLKSSPDYCRMNATAGYKVGLCCINRNISVTVCNYLRELLEEPAKLTPKVQTPREQSESAPSYAASVGFM